ncbi:MAG: metal-sulfur cluster biosynthetic enzyme [Trueperaceae bacterium]|nr:metal-sulfur cluster biosynthetic enzyme [Trueperaceae bacterium]|tara:strand:- start:177 stop:512 length:336 start_codon:yes stop_codon:yes gene_type:complete
MSAPENSDQFKDEILEALKVVRDPEIPVNVVDLGLVYHLEVSDEGAVDIEMTLTSPGCPVMDMIQADAELAAMQVDGVTKASVTFVWDPVWTTEKMTEDGKKQMRMFGFSV